MRRGSPRFFGTRILLISLLAIAINSAAAQTNFTVLKSFTGFPDGAVPACTLVDGKNGALYGTTAGGGISNLGTVFRLNMDGSGFTILKSFIGSDGVTPYAGLTLSTNGSLFGTTYSGGISNSGTVFKVNLDGSGFAIVHHFLGGDDSANPMFAKEERPL